MAHPVTHRGWPAPEPGLPDDTVPESTARPAAAPSRIVARVALGRALAARRIDIATLQGVVVIGVPGPDWVDPVCEAWPEMTGRSDRREPEETDGLPAGQGHWMILTGDPPLSRHEHGRILASLARGRGILAVSQVPDRQLPPDLLRAADLRLTLPPLDPEGLGEVAAVLTGGPPAALPSAEICALVSPRTLGLARRPGQSADDLLERAARIAAGGLRQASGPGTSLGDLPGMPEAVAWGHDLACDLAAYAAGTLPWRDVDRGCLLAGPPGTGKTSFARALAATCGVPLVAASYAQWQSSGDGHLGTLLRAMRASFDAARAAAPCILFIDELDSFQNRAAETRHRDWWTSVIGGLLEQLDGLEGREGVVVLGATNHPGMIDPAILRAGRLDRSITIPLPDRTALAAILRVHLGDDLAGEDLARAALHARGGTGADCAKWVRGARRRARGGGRAMDLEDLLAEIRGGAGLRPPEERRIPAVHEAGHALLQALECPGTLRLVSIREEAWSCGRTVIDRVDEDASEVWLGQQLRRLLAGRAAEQEVFGQVTGGAGGPAGSDLARATCLAVNAETALGLSGRPLLWRGFRDGPEVAALVLARPDIARRAETRLEAAYGEARALLRRHRAVLDAVVAALLEREVLEGAEVEAILRAGRQP